MKDFKRITFFHHERVWINYKCGLHSSNSSILQTLVVASSFVTCAPFTPSKKTQIFHPAFGAALKAHRPPNSRLN